MKRGVSLLHDGEKCTSCVTPSRHRQSEFQVFVQSEKCQRDVAMFFLIFWLEIGLAINHQSCVWYELVVWKARRKERT